MKQLTPKTRTATRDVDAALIACIVVLGSLNSLSYQVRISKTIVRKHIGEIDAKREPMPKENWQQVGNILSERKREE